VNRSLPLFKVNINPSAAAAAVRDVAKSGFINEGVQVTQLTEFLSRRLGSQKLLLTNSCTSAITLALYLAGVRCGDDVVSTSMTCVATNTPIVTSGAYVVWADIDPTTGMITAETVESVITDRTKAVIVVAWAGLVPRLSELKKLCSDRGIALIVDAAHAFDADCGSTKMHEHADFVCYSFQAIKHFTTGDGGALVCADDDDFARAKKLKWFGIDRDYSKDAEGNWKAKQWDVPVDEAGFKFNMNNISAAIGLMNLRNIDSVISAHRQNAKRYTKLFKQRFKALGIEPTVKTLNVDPETTPSYWVYPLTITDKSTVTRDELISELNARGIGAGVVHVPNHHYKAFERYDKYELPNTLEFSDKQFNLPCGKWVTNADVKTIVDAVITITTRNK